MIRDKKNNASDMRLLFGRAVRKNRKNRKMTQEGLGEAVGLTRGMIGQMERGTAAPSFATIEAISEVLTVHPAELLGGGARLEPDGRLKGIAALIAQCRDEDLEMVERVLRQLTHRRME